MKRKIAAFAEKQPWFKSMFDYYAAFKAAKTDLFFHKTLTGPDGYAVPGPLLLVATTGNPDPAIYLESGEKAMEAISNSFAAAGIHVSTLRRILDFGCGCGRVLRQWHSSQNTEIHGVDIDRRAVRWCRQNLPFAHVKSCDLTPPLSCADGFFDFVYAFSVLTHLPEHLQKSWLREWHRILAPEGLLLFSVHGDHYRSSLNDEERLSYDQNHLVLRNPASAGSNRCGAFHPRQYVLKVLLEGFDLLEHVPNGALGNPHQDLYFFRKVENK